MYPPIPALAPVAPGESLNQYAARALAHAMHHGSATLSDEDIAQAIRFAVIAQSAPGIAPTASTTINATVHQLRAAQRHRADADTAARARLAEQLAGSATPPPAGPGSGGTRVLAERTPPPRYPPAGAGLAILTNGSARPAPAGIAPPADLF
jgi:hypothetical protein